MINMLSEKRPSIPLEELFPSDVYSVNVRLPTLKMITSTNHCCMFLNNISVCFLLVQQTDHRKVESGMLLSKSRQVKHVNLASIKERVPSNIGTEMGRKLNELAFY